MLRRWAPGGISHGKPEYCPSPETAGLAGISRDQSNDSSHAGGEPLTASHLPGQHLAVGDIIPDYGGRNATFEAAMLQAPFILVYQSARGPANLTWPITLTPVTKITGIIRIG
jgi:hypothetical protein